MKFLFLGHVNPGEHRLVVDLNDEEAALLNGIAQALRQQMGDKGPPPAAGAPVPAPRTPAPPVHDRRTPRPNPNREQAKELGFEGDPCIHCGLFMLVRNGTCLKCTGCGETSGCS